MKGFLISESKKSEAAKRLGEKYSDEIVALLDYDPTGYKYIPWIEKQIDKFFEPGGKHTRMGSVSPEEYFRVFFKHLPNFHNFSSSITNKFLDYFGRETDDGYRTPDNLDSILQNPKDINSYSLMDFLIFTETLEKYIDEKNKKKKAIKQITKVYDDGRYLVIEPDTHLSSCFYGKGTKWCTTAQNDDYFKKYRRRGRLLYFIDRKGIKPKMAAFIPMSGPQEYYNAADQGITKRELVSSFPFANDLLDNIIAPSKTYKNLISLVQNKNHESVEDLENGDPIIHGVDGDYLNLRFSDEHNFWNLFEDLDDMDKYVLQMYESSDFDIVSYDSVDSDWEEGYLLNYLNPQQRKKLYDSLYAMAPSLRDCVEKLRKSQGYGDEECNAKISKFLSTSFSKEVDDIIFSILSDRNNAMKAGVSEHLISNYFDMFEKYGLETEVDDTTFYNIRVKIPEIIELYEKYNPKRDSSIFGLLKKVIQTENIEPPELTDLIWELESPNYEWLETEMAFDNLLENMDEEFYDENFSEEFDKSYNFVESLGGLGKMFEAPFDKNYLIKVVEIKPNGNVNFVFHHKDSEDKKGMSLPLKNFKEFLYNKKLFDL